MKLEGVTKLEGEVRGRRGKRTKTQSKGSAVESERELAALYTCSTRSDRTLFCLNRLTCRVTALLAAVCSASLVFTVLPDIGRCLPLSDMHFGLVASWRFRPASYVRKTSTKLFIPAHGLYKE